MRNTSSNRRAARVGVAVIVAVGLAGCAHVKPQDLDDRLGALRNDIDSELQSLAGEIDGLEGRVSAVETRLAAVERELGRLETEFGTTVERMGQALRFNIPVYFDFDRDELTPEHLEVLDRFASVIREYYPDCLVTAEGFTDPAGSQEYNKALGLRRAEAVKAYLEEEGGLDGDRLRAVSYGEGTNRQVAQGAHGPGESGWENRRVALVVDHRGA